MGRLETGETFGLLDSRARPGFYVRVSDRERVRYRGAGELRESGLETMDGEEVERIDCQTLRSARSLAKQLQEGGVRTYEADLNHCHQYLIERDLRGSVRIFGEWQPGRGVDRVYIDPRLEACEWEPELAVLARRGRRR